MAGKRIVVLGGGFGGAAAARRLRRLLPLEHSVTLIDRNRRTFLCGANPLLIIGRREADRVSRSLGRLAAYGVEFVQADITRIDTVGRVVRTPAGDHPYDYLVVALGAEYNWDAVPGSRQAYSFYNIETARRMRTRLSRFRRGRVVIAVSGMPYKCPPAPFETAMLLHWEFRRRGIRRDTEVHVYIQEPMPLAIAGPAASARLRADLEARGIELHTGAVVKEVARSGREASFSDGSSIEGDLVATIPVHRLPRVVAESGLAAGKPWVPVNAGTLETATPDVFAIGDVNMVPFAEGRALPKAGVFAAGEAETVASLIASRITGSEPPPAYDGSGECFLAYSGAQSAFVGGTFLAKPAPQIALKPPTAAGMRGKDRFERDWKRFRI